MAKVILVNEKGEETLRNQADMDDITALLESRGWQLVKQALIETRENKKEQLTISNETEDEILKGVCQGLQLAIDMPDMVKKEIKNKGVK